MSTKAPQAAPITGPCSELQISEIQDQKQRNLINQRNFRTRRKQYVVELEQKLRDYETAGVAATRHVQMAARVVAAENVVLRNLVKARLGWKQEDLHRYISEEMRHDQGRNIDGAHDIEACSRFQEESFRTKDNQEPQLRTSPKDPLRRKSEDSGGQGVNGSSQSINYMAPRTSNDHPKAQDVSSVSQLSIATAVNNNDNRDVAIYQEPTSSVSLVEDAIFKRDENLHENKQPEDFMSCEQAANIISELRVQEDLELIRQELGCLEYSTCHIAHRDLYQKLDEAI